MKSSPMSGSQWMAWTLCLTLALGAVFLSLSNAYRVSRIEREEGSATLTLLREQTELLREVRTLLKPPKLISEATMEGAMDRVADNAKDVPLESQINDCGSRVAPCFCRAWRRRA